MLVGVRVGVCLWVRLRKFGKRTTFGLKMGVVMI